MKKLELHWQILLGLVLAVGVGVVFDADARVAGIPLADGLGFLGDLFLRGLKMLVVPLIVSSVIVGVMGAPEQESGRGGSTGGRDSPPAEGEESRAAGGSGAGAGIGVLGAKTVAYYVLSSLVAIVIGLGFVVLIEPGVVDGRPAKDLIGLSADTGEVARQVEGRGAGDLVDVVLRMVPTNVFGDAAAGEMLGVIFFSILFGYFARGVRRELRDALSRFWNGVYEVMLAMTDFILLFAPVGVFGLVARVALETGASAIGPLAAFFFTVIAALAMHALVVLPLVLLVVGRVQPLRHFKVMAPALLMAFSTASSAGTLPLTLERVGLAGVSKRVSGFTLPLGATVNMDGTALYECVAAVFIAQAYGIELGFAQLFFVVVVALMTSIGVAGIPAASLVAITLILSSMGLPIEGVGLILAVDRLLDMCRTSVNVFSDSCAAVVIAKSEGEVGVLAAELSD